MFDLAVHLLRFRSEVTSPLRLPPATGAALRGALFGALRDEYCAAGGGSACGQPPTSDRCPVCFLLAPVAADHPRGRDVPRPYVRRVAPGASLAYAPGQTFEFALATFGRALGVFPYALLGVQAMGQRGLGVGRGGRFRLTEVWAENPLAGAQERVYRAADGGVATPALPVDATQVAAAAAALAGRFAGAAAPDAGPAVPMPHAAPGAQRASGTARPALRLTFRTPTRLVEGGRLVKPDTFALRSLLARLLERLDALGDRYGAGPTGVTPAVVLAQAERVHVAERRLAWRDLFRGSGRHGRQLPMGGLVGEVVLDGDVEPLLPWLLWGSLVHVGKDAAMGNGLFAVEIA
ncbi:MAG TPA: CRISPR system precrRNA processing endoribonuclease RAMP protein Cas6 [Chloroflexota bacterium]|nr:CRISPR system precrRNA processing endoribonuclease RAMP protein Cas6 [Chloroflexota bacterium]